MPNSIEVRNSGWRMALRPAVLLAGVCATAAAALFARIGLDTGSTGIQLAQWRLTMASTILIAWRVWRPVDELRFTLVERWRIAGAGFFLALHFAAWLTSLSYISVARSTLLVATSPLWAGLLGLFVPSMRPQRSFWWGLLLSAAGMGIFSLGRAGPVHFRAARGPSWLGDLLALAGAVFVLGYFLLSKRIQRDYDTGRTVTWVYSAAALTMWPIALAAGGPIFPTSGSFWTAVIGMALCAQLVGHTSLNWSLRHFSAGQVGAATLVEPVFAAVLAWILLGESLGGVQVVGGAVLLAGVSLALRSESLSAQPSG